MKALGKEPGTADAALHRAALAIAFILLFSGAIFAPCPEPDCDIVPTVKSYMDIILDPVNKEVTTFVYNVSGNYVKSGVENALIFRVNMSDPQEPDLCYDVADIGGWLRQSYDPNREGCTDYWYIFCPLAAATSDLNARETCLSSTGLDYNSFIKPAPHACDDSDLYMAHPASYTPPPAADHPEFILSHNELYFCNHNPKNFSEFCWPLMLIFGLLVGASFAAGRNPFAAFDFSSPRMSRGRQYTTRQQNRSIDLAQIISAVSQASGTGKGSGSGGGKGKGWLGKLFNAMVNKKGGKRTKFGTFLGKIVSKVNDSRILKNKEGGQSKFSKFILGDKAKGTPELFGGKKSGDQESQAKKEGQPSTTFNKETNQFQFTNQVPMAMQQLPNLTFKQRKTIGKLKKINKKLSFLRPGGGVIDSLASRKGGSGGGNDAGGGKKNQASRGVSSAAGSGNLLQQAIDPMMSVRQTSNSLIGGVIRLFFREGEDGRKKFTLRNFFTFTTEGEGGKRKFSLGLTLRSLFNLLSLAATVTATLRIGNVGGAVAKIDNILNFRLFNMGKVGVGAMDFVSWMKPGYSGRSGMPYPFSMVFSGMFMQIGQAIGTAYDSHTMNAGNAGIQKGVQDENTKEGVAYDGNGNLVVVTKDGKLVSKTTYDYDADSGKWVIYDRDAQGQKKLDENNQKPIVVQELSLKSGDLNNYVQGQGTARLTALYLMENSDGTVSKISKSRFNQITWIAQQQCIAQAQILAAEARRACTQTTSNAVDEANKLGKIKDKLTATPEQAVASASEIVEQVASGKTTYAEAMNTSPDFKFLVENEFIPAYTKNEKKWAKQASGHIDQLELGLAKESQDAYMQANIASSQATAYQLMAANLAAISSSRKNPSVDQQMQYAFNWNAAQFYSGLSDAIKLNSQKGIDELPTYDQMQEKLPVVTEMLETAKSELAADPANLVKIAQVNVLQYEVETTSRILGDSPAKALLDELKGNKSILQAATNADPNAQKVREAYESWVDQMKAKFYYLTQAQQVLAAANGAGVGNEVMKNIDINFINSDYDMPNEFYETYMKAAGKMGVIDSSLKFGAIAGETGQNSALDRLLESGMEPADREKFFVDVMKNSKTELLMHYKEAASKEDFKEFKKNYEEYADPSGLLETRKNALTRLSDFPEETTFWANGREYSKEEAEKVLSDPIGAMESSIMDGSSVKSACEEYNAIAKLNKMLEKEEPMVAAKPLPGEPAQFPSKQRQDEVLENMRKQYKKN